MIRSVLFFSLILTTFSCDDNDHSDTNHEEQHWSYSGETGPEHWDEIEVDSDCNGKRQSPINIIDIEAISDSLLHPLTFNYSDSVKIHDVTNNGHSIQYNYEKGDYLALGNVDYELIQIHFHEPSEHTINGLRYPIEMHMVHINKNKEVVVIAVLGVEGKNNEAFEFLESYLPIQIGETKKIDDYFNFNLKLPDNREYYNYQGSLTTPPCSEGVDWYVFKTPITLSVNQVKQLQELMPLNNYRNEQPINARVVKKTLPKN